MEICGKPMLELLVERLKLSRLIDEIVIATTDHRQDTPIVELAERLKIGCFRGSEDDVLGRVVGALKEFKVGIHAEFQGDNVMPDPMLIDSVIGYYLKHSDQCDYVTNGLKTTYPPGQEVAVYASSVLVEAERDWQRKLSREHVGIHIYRRPDKFRVMNIEAPPWHHRPDYHLEVDTQEDFEVVRKVFEHFHPNHPGFSLSEIILFLEQSRVFETNRDVGRRWYQFREDS
jgi:spore coat polysaccharide biosynthesis protein SpsF